MVAFLAFVFLYRGLSGAMVSIHLENFQPEKVQERSSKTPANVQEIQELRNPGSLPRLDRKVGNPQQIRDILVFSETVVI
jgi:hypothetical protein